MITKIITKADAMAFAVEQAGVDNLDKADKIYRMFDDNVHLLDVHPTIDGLTKLAEATTHVAERLSQFGKESAKIKTVYDAAPQPSAGTIILPGLPGLEWMTENLKGLGGTEIDGRWYYTYDEAEQAVKKLVKGWRLPTQAEWEALCDLGSEWQEEGPHGLPGRLFGGGLFLEAAGYRLSSSGALTNVGTSGYYWSSSSYAAGNRRAGGLYFNSGAVNPLYGNDRANAFSVRCVRNRQ